MKKLLPFLLFFSVYSQSVDTSHIYVSINYEGKIIDYVDPAEWKVHPDSIFKNINNAFKYMPVPREQKKDFEKFVQDTTGKYRVDYRLMESWIGDKSFIKDFHSGKSAIILPKNIDYKPLVKDKKNVKNPKIRDRFAWSIGDSTIGSGGDYATIALWIADAAATLTGNAKGTVISDVTESATANFTENISTYNLTLDSNVPNDGNPNSGWVISCNNAAAHGIVFNYSGSGDIEIRDLTFKITASDAGGFAQIVLSNTTTATGDFRIRDCIFDGNGTDGRAIDLGDNSPTIELFNLVVHNHDVAQQAFQFTSTSGSMTIENITFYDCVVAIDNNNQTQSYNNIAFFSCGTNIRDVTNSTSNYCATDKASVGAGTNNNAQVSLTVANEVVSITDTHADFMRAKVGGTIDSNGTTVSIDSNTAGIRGNARPTGTNYSIGADQYQETDTIIRYVNTASSAGGDGTTNEITGANRAYATLTEWEANEQTDLVAAGDVHIVYCEGSAADEKASVDGWTVDADNKIIIEVLQENRSPGAYSESHYRIESGSSSPSALTIKEDYTEVYGVQVKTTRTSGSAEGLELDRVSECKIGYCIVVLDLSSSAFGYAVYMDSTTGGNKIFRNIVYGTGSVQTMRAFSGANSPVGTDTLYNNTAYYGSTGTEQFNEFCKNNIFINFSSECFGGTVAGSDYNVASDATAPGANSVQNVDIGTQFADTASGSEDLHLVAGSDAVGAGVNLGSPYNIDIEGITVPESWDIGADQLCAASYDTTCLSNDSAAIDSILCGDTTRIDTVFPTIDTTVVGGDSIQLTISACDGDTTALDTFFVGGAVVNVYDGKIRKEDIRDKTIQDKAIIKDRRDELFY